MPITETIYNVLYNDEDVQQAAKEIMLRDGKTENEFTLDFRRKKMKVKKAVIPAAGLEHVSCRLPKRWQKKCYRLLINQRFNLS